MAIIIETCPECGHDLIDEMICTNPPIPRKFCPNCGWRWEGKRDEVIKIRFGENMIDSEDKIMDNKDIVSKIKEKAYENVNRKVGEERKRTEDKINNELADVEKCLSYINNKLVYKIIKCNYRPVEYELADEEMFFDDYSKDDKWNQGIHFPENKEYLFIVNGEKYYDVRNLLPKYRKDIEEYWDDLRDLNEHFADLEKGYKKLLAQEANVKSMLEQLKKVEIKEED